MTKLLTQSKALVDISAAEENQIEKFISDSDDSTIFHTIIWNKIINNHFSEVKGSCRIVFSQKGGRICGSYIFYLTKSNFLFNSLNSSLSNAQTPYGGPIHRGDQLVAKELIRESENFWGIQKFSITSNPFSEIKITGLEKFSKRILETVVLDLTVSESDLWKNLDKKTRNQVRKAEKSGINIEILDTFNSDLIEMYFHMIEMTMGGISNSRKSFYEDVINILSHKKKLKIFMAKYNEEYISGAIILIFEKIIYYWDGASNKKFQKLSPNNLLQWEIIKWARENNYESYDFVRIEPEKLPGIAKFKLGWGGKVIPYYKFYKSKKLYNVAKFLYGLKNFNE